MEEKVTEFNITVPWLERKIVKINKEGKTDLVLKNVKDENHLNIDNYNYPWHLLTEEDQETKRYVCGKFTKVCDRLEMNVTPGLEYIADDNSDKVLHLEVIGVKITPDNAKEIREKYSERNGYERFNISSITERHPDGHGDWEYTDHIYDENGYYPVDENGNPIIKKWSYKYDRYVYFYKVIN